MAALSASCWSTDYSYPRYRPSASLKNNWRGRRIWIALGCTLINPSSKVAKPIKKLIVCNRKTRIKSLIRGSKARNLAHSIDIKKPKLAIYSKNMRKTVDRSPICSHIQLKLRKRTRVGTTSILLKSNLKHSIPIENRKNFRRLGKVFINLKTSSFTRI